MSPVSEEKQRRDLFDGEICTRIGLWVNAGHAIASEVKAALIESDLRIVDAMVHVNPAVEDEP